jgi:hypothetical protein
MTIAKCILYAAAITAAASIPAPVRAQSCDAALNNLQTWLTEPTFASCVIQFRLVSHRSDGAGAIRRFPSHSLAREKSRFTHLL